MGNNSSSKRKSIGINNYMELFSTKDSSQPMDERMQLGNYIMRELWNGSFSSPIKDLLTNGGAKVLDVGCGTGTWMFEVAADYQKSRYIGVDMVQLFPTGAIPFNVKFIKENLLDGLPFEDESFDFVHAQYLIFDIKEVEWEEFVYKELIRVLKPGGWLEISDPEFRISKAGKTTQKFLKTELMTRNPELKLVQHQVREYPLNRWDGRLGEIGRSFMMETCRNLMYNIYADMKIKKRKVDETVEAMVEEWKVVLMENQIVSPQIDEKSRSNENSKCIIIEKRSPPASSQKNSREILQNPCSTFFVISSREKGLSADHEEDDPRNWSTKKKNFILFIIATAGILAPISSTIFFPAITVVRNDLRTTEVLANGLVAIFILFTGIAPLAWASYSDTRATRRKVYLASIMLFLVASIICAFANNIWMLMVMRAFQACGSSAVQSIGAGSISDVFNPHGELIVHEHGRAYGIFYVGPLIGPLIGPIIGGFLTDYLGWRWIFWFLTIFGGILFLFIFFALPETFRDRSASSLRRRFNPFLPLSLLRYPNVMLSLVYVSSIFAIVYTQNTLLSRNFTQLYNLKTSDVGLVFLGPGTGYMIGSVIGGRYSDFMLKRAGERNDGIGHPEMRLSSTWVAMVLIPVSYIAYGWVVAYRLNIALPLIAMFLGELLQNRGFGCLTVFNSVSTYLVDAFPGRSASAIALNNFVRSVAAAGMSAAAAPLQNALGVGWLYTMMVGLTILGSGCLVLVFVKGKRWREELESRDT
ncbi:16859_t:CDS:10 [Acaulospora colombiana]|uniref:16859_t:CDS:1 n=1 Tax=Acaulospora colombiana TaxID=27376 RepID=A0ACA9KHB9_9GLOM|nr:16859_t:CDS:10 [Acaulospora colombiana]